ncbi:PAS domain-containing protein [Halobaculum sp. D14]|uniref:sensor histidine kinase n=1 Tax=Halobaculum sp. D14 TaxID=3421642 RepID=UPI003EB812C6
MTGSRNREPFLPRAVVDALPCGFATFSADGSLYDSNEAWENAAIDSGIPVPEPGGAPYLDSIGDAADPDVRSLADRIDDLLGSDDDRDVRVEVDAVPFAVVPFTHDGARYVTVLESAGQSESRVAVDLRLKQRAMDEAPVGITISNPRLPDNPVIYANAAFERITGYPLDEVLGRNCRFLQGEGTDEAPVAEMRAAVDERRSVTVVVRNYTRSGEPFWNEVTISPLNDGDGNTTHFVGFQKDVTDRVAAERELERERNRLAVLNQIVRHDIRNDMSVALGWGEILGSHVDDGEAEDALERVLNAATHTKNLTGAVGDLAEILGADDPELTEVSLRDTIDSEVTHVRSNFDYRAGPLTVDVGDVPDVDVEATALLSSVLGNVLDNAVFHNDSDDVHIDVSVEERPETVVVRIADNGPGIPDDRKRDVFGRGEKGLESAGSGLGLYLADNLVETYGGSIWVVDNEPTGAVFCIELRRADGGAA